jgi:hypothetical protein
MVEPQALEVEAAVIDALDASMNGPALNEILGQKVERGILYASDIVALAATPVNPMKTITVFIFPIQNALHRLGNKLTDMNIIYQATRGDWRVTPKYRKKSNDYAVGLVGGISMGAFAIDEWSVNGAGKCYFDEISNISDADPKAKVLASIKNKSWLNVIAPAKGYYQRGNHLVVEFNEQRQFRIIRGCPDHQWTNCI